MVDERLQATLEMAKDAGALARQMRQDPKALQTQIKGHMDLVTAADRASEDLLRQRIEAFDPGAAILGEEDGLKGSGRRIWILDPIDGTVNYYRGTPNWAISVAHLDGDVLTHGVIYAPDLGMTAWACRDQGCFLNGHRVVFDDTLMQNPTIAMGHSQRSMLSGYFESIERFRDAGIEHRHYGAATIGFIGVLAGWFDAFYEPALNIWDAAAGLLLIEEAGGKIRHGPFAEFLHGPTNVMARNRAMQKFSHLLD